MTDNPSAALAWSLYPVTHGYITDYQGPNTDTPHYALDIGTPFHTAVGFPDSGTVVQEDYAMWNGKPGGGEIFIKPDNPALPEEYMYHLDQFLPGVSPGTHLQAGQQVGWSGGQNTGGTHPTDPMWSSGPHLHVGYFTNFVNTPEGSRPYGPNPQQLVDEAYSGYNPNNAANTGNNPAGDTAANIADTVQKFIHSDVLLRVGMFAVGGLVIVGGVVMLSHTGEK